MFRKILFFILLAITPTIAFCQVPSTDIFISDIKISKDGVYKFSTPVNITNREGYDNQPAFAPNGKIYYTSLHDSTGTDIYVYDPANSKTTRLTKTPESEYSPTLMPSNKAISVVRVDRDSLQRLYQVTLDGRASKLLLKDQDSIGYHCWLDDKKIALFILGDTATLRIADMNSQKSETVVSNVGRCIALVPGTNQVSYVEKISPSEWYIKAYNPDTKKSAFLMKTLEGSEDYVWTSDKKLLMGKNGKLYISDPYKAELWKQIADFSIPIGTFYRIAINPGNTRIALVSYKGNQP